MVLMSPMNENTEKRRHAAMGLSLFLGRNQELQFEA